ncbi:MAG: L-threonylcarbamoyladenylate synthase [Gemmatimonadales bacterium]
MILPFQTGEQVEAAIPRVIAHLRAGRLIGYPTETVYGVGSLATDAGLDALARLKGRPPRKPFLLLISSRLMAERANLHFSPAAKAMADAFWPGPLTLVLPGGEGKLPSRLRGAEGGVAVRHTSHLGMARLVEALGEPVTSTSANRPGGPPAPGAAMIGELFPAAVADGSLLILDGGVLGNVPPSTLIDCTTSTPTLIREGAIPRGELRRAVGRFAP